MPGTYSKGKIDIAGFSVGIVDEKNILYKKNDPFTIKMTAEIEVFYSHNFLSETNNYIEKLKDIISGTDKSDALKTLINNPKISDAKIETRPFFMKTISKLPGPPRQ